MSNYRIISNQEQADIFKALSNPHRLQIFMSLLCNCTHESNIDSEDQICTCVGTLGKDLDIAPSTVSHHLKELRRAGLIKMQRRGKSIDCRVDPEIVESITMFFKQASCV